MKKHYNLTTTEDNGKSITTTNTSTEYPEELVRLLALAGQGMPQIPAEPVAPVEDDCGCGCGETPCGCGSMEEAEYEATPANDKLDLDDFSKKTADSISRQKKKIQPSAGDNPLEYSVNEDDIYEALMREWNESVGEGCPCCGGGRCTCPGDCPDCNCHGNNDWDESVEEEAVTEASKDVYAMVSYDYKDDWGSIELVIDNETVEDWNDYFGANETGNPLAAKFVELCKKHGIDPTDVHILSGADEDIHPIRGRKSGYFDGKTFKWNESAN